MLGIPGFEDTYKATRNGQIWSIRRKKFLQPATDKDGYKKLTLYVNNNAYYRRVHRLIAFTYLPNPENKLYVNHLDGVKTNNNVINLEWCTQSENELHAWATGLKTPSELQRRAVIANNKLKRKLTNDTEIEIIRLYSTKTNNQKELSKLYNISQSQISVIVNRNPEYYHGLDR